jgi:hypothetical protein
MAVSNEPLEMLKEGKIIPVLLLNKHHAMNAYCGVEV